MFVRLKGKVPSGVVVDNGDFGRTCSAMKRKVVQRHSCQVVTAGVFRYSHSAGQKGPPRGMIELIFYSVPEKVSAHLLVHHQSQGTLENSGSQPYPYPLKGLTLPDGRALEYAHRIVTVPIRYDVKYSIAAPREI